MDGTRLFRGIEKRTASFNGDEGGMKTCENGNHIANEPTNCNEPHDLREVALLFPPGQGTVYLKGK